MRQGPPPELPCQSLDFPYTDSLIFLVTFRVGELDESQIPGPRGFGMYNHAVAPSTQ